MKFLYRTLLRAVAVVTVVAAVQLFPQSWAWSAPETRTQFASLTADEVLETPFPLSHAAIKWQGDPEATVIARGANAKGDWDVWKPVNIDHDSENPSGLVTFDAARKLEVKVVDGDVHDISAQLIDTVNGPRHIELKSNEKPAGAIDGAHPSPDIISRSQWGADESLRKGTPIFAPTTRFIVHHTDTANSDPNPAATVRAILAFHTGSNGWDDIGYNFLIDQQGRIYEGRYAGGPVAGENANGDGVIGAHAVGANSGSIGISMLGNFTSASPTSPQLASLAKLIAWKGDRKNIDLGNAANIVGHRDVGQSSCPGNVAESLLPQIRSDANTIKTISYPPGNTPGYWIAGRDGSVRNYGAAADYGSMAGKGLNGEVVSMARTPSAKGYWLLGTDGGVFAYGDARFYGSTGSIKLNKPVVGMAPTPSGNGYWFVASDGGVFAYGDAKFYGSMGGKPLNKPIVGMAATPSGKGYWMVASDGGIFAYGDAGFYGSTGSIKLNQPIVTMASAPNGNGYWLMAKDGGVFAYNTRFMGSVPMLKVVYNGTTQAAATKTGLGYYMLAEDGGLYTFGDAKFHGAATGSVRAAAIALMPES